MKDSGVEWIGEIPSDWKILRLKNVLKERNEKNSPIKTNEILSLTIEKGVIPYKEKKSGGNKAKEDLSNYKLAYPNDIVLNSMNVIVGAVGISKYYGCVSPVYYVLYSDDVEQNIRFYNYLFQSSAFQKSLIGLGNGIMMKQSSTGKLNTIRLRIPLDRLKNVYLPVPPVSVQQKIVNFLDEKVSHIDTIIEKNKQSIEELKKYKQSLIAETVTKGLDPNVEMKDSGIEWVGEIPKHWEIRRLRDISIITRGTVDKSKEKNEIPVYLVQYTNVYYKREQKINDDDYLPITVSENEYKKYKVRKGDILLTASSETKDDIGHSTVIVEDLPNHVFGSDIIRIRIPNKIVDLNYKKYFMENYYYLAKFDKLSRGITRFRFGMDQFKSLKYVIPPIEEQVKIAKYLDNITNHINQLICNKEKLINELESYKKSLIYEYVTGKKEVM